MWRQGISSSWSFSKKPVWCECPITVWGPKKMGGVCVHVEGWGSMHCYDSNNLAIHPFYSLLAHSPVYPPCPPTPYIANNMHSIIFLFVAFNMISIVSFNLPVYSWTVCWTLYCCSQTQVVEDRLQNWGLNTLQTEPLPQIFECKLLIGNQYRVFSTQHNITKLCNIQLYCYVLSYHAVEWIIPNLECIVHIMAGWSEGVGVHGNLNTSPNLECAGKEKQGMGVQRELVSKLHYLRSRETSLSLCSV